MQLLIVVLRLIPQDDPHVANTKIKTEGQAISYWREINEVITDDETIIMYMNSKEPYPT